MLYGFLFTLLVLDAIVLGAAILMQSGKGGGMAASFGGASSSDAVLGVRQAGNFLTAASWWAGGIFLALAFILSMMSTRNRLPESVLDQPLQTAPAPVTSGARPLPLETAPTTTTAPAKSAPATGAPATPTPTPKP